MASCARILNDLLCLVRVYGTIVQFRPDFCKKNLDFICLPVQSSRKQPKADSLEPFGMSYQLKLANFFQDFIFWPRARWRFKDDLFDVDKASLLKPFEVFAVKRDGSVVIGGGFNYKSGPVAQIMILPQRPIVGDEAAIELL